VLEAVDRLEPEERGGAGGGGQPEGDVAQPDEQVVLHRPRRRHQPPVEGVPLPVEVADLAVERVEHREQRPVGRAHRLELAVGGLGLALHPLEAGGGLVAEEVPDGDVVVSQRRLPRVTT
jgi:hypothetical protein